MARTGTGTAGRTHCGRWTTMPNDDRALVDRLVCTLPPNHPGPHRSRSWLGWSWTDDDPTPRRAPAQGADPDAG